MFNLLLRKLSQLLYPRGRAFRMPPGGRLDKLHKALAISENQLFEDAAAILNAAIADNPGFTAADATDWERRLGLATSPTLALAIRILAINQKHNFPGTDDPRQHHTFLTAQLQAAGFNVKIYENNFSGVTQTPTQLLGSGGGTLHAPVVRHGSVQHGEHFSNIIANYLDEPMDATFVVGSNYRSTFYIASPTSITTFASVPTVRKNEFRQLILSLKPAHTVGFLFVNYV